MRDTQGERTVLAALADAHLKQGNHAQAVELYEQASGVGDPHLDPAAEISIITGLAAAHAALGQAAEAATLYERAALAHAKLGNRALQGGNLILAGCTLGDVGELT